MRKYKDEEQKTVPGLHEAIISESLYYDVQDVLRGRKRGEYRSKITSDARMPLRGFMICPKCEKLLTASASKGCRQYYAYYHCTMGCSTRYRCEEVNAKFFVLELTQMKPRQEYIDEYQNILQKTWEEQSGENRSDRAYTLKQIRDLEEKLAYLRELLMSKKIDPLEFREMKSDYTNQLEKLEARLSSVDNKHTNIEPLFKKGIPNLLQLDAIYQNSSIESKRKLIGSIYPENFTFDGANFRTTRINEAVRLIYLINNNLEPKKTRTTKYSFQLSAREVSSVLPYGSRRFPLLLFNTLKYL